jgi:hypothetical protein
VFAVLPAVGVFGCGDSDGDGGSNDVELGAAKPLVDAWCGAVRSCCGKAGFPAAPLADCESELVRQSDLVGALASGEVTAIEPAFSTCVEAFRTTGSTCTANASLFAPCNDAWSGRTMLGGSCDDVINCVNTGPTACIMTNSADIGVCTALERGTLGDPCMFSVNESQHSLTYGTSEATVTAVYCDASDGLYCAYSSDTCTALPELGQACQYDCAPGSTCFNDVCVTPKALGVACSDWQECESSYCGSGGVCETRPFVSDDACSGDYN